MKHVEPAFLLTRRRGYFILRASDMPVPYTTVSTTQAAPEYDLTIVTVCLNVLPALKRTTESVLAHKRKYPELRIEHLVIDGQSTDGTAAWLRDGLAQRRIEAYISEPDRGIYDAMNKGINFARGEVILFLNADDTLTAENLAPCVRPIQRGETASVAAVSRFYSDTEDTFFQPDVESLYLQCPFCHQAYFASARRLRELGGFDSMGLRCSADADLMFRIIAASGLPKILGTVVSEMPMGGFSADSANRYRDEYIEMLYRYRDAAFARCELSAEYARLLLSTLLYHAIALRGWQKKYHREIPEQLEKLRLLCEESVHYCAGEGNSLYALQYVSQVYLPCIQKGGLPSLFSLLRLVAYYRSNEIPVGSPYRSRMVGVKTILKSIFRESALGRRFCCR